MHRNVALQRTAGWVQVDGRHHLTWVGGGFAYDLMIAHRLNDKSSSAALSFFLSCRSCEFVYRDGHHGEGVGNTLHGAECTRASCI